MAAGLSVPRETATCPPRTIFYIPRKKGSYISDPKEVHDHFGEAWGKVYCRHERQGEGEGTNSNEEQEIWSTFKNKYGEHIPKSPFCDRPFTDQDFIDQLNQMKESAAGFDGWTRDALKIPPRKAWADRARIENLALKLGIFPDADLHVPLPMLPKGQALTPQHHRGITILSMVHRVIIGALWNRSK